MQKESSEMILFVIVTLTILFLILTVSVILSVIAYKRSRIRHVVEIKEKENQYRQEILKAQLEVKEQTLRSISEELHDNIGQVLSLVKLNLATLPNDPLKSEKKLADTRQLVKSLSEDLRHMSRLLHPDHGDLSLADVLRNELEKLEQSGMYQIEFTEKGIERRLPPNVHILIYRMIQEILNNIIKHAEADNISILLDANNMQTSITIKDNGRGFDVEYLDRTEHRKGMGLENLKYRASLIGATIYVDSELGIGTSITLSLMF